MKNKQETLRYESVTLGLPPLKMILVETEIKPGQGKIIKKAGSRKSKKVPDERQVILKLIRHLMETDL